MDLLQYGRGLQDAQNVSMQPFVSSYSWNDTKALSPFSRVPLEETPFGSWDDEATWRKFDFGEDGKSFDPESDDGWMEPPAVLETLPAELRLQILMEMPDVYSLGSLIKASPVMFAQYQADAQETILQTCLSRELDGFLVDAYATAASRASQFGLCRTNNNISHFLGVYHGWLAASAATGKVERMGQSNCRWIAAYHAKVVRPMAKMYTKWAVNNLRKAALAAEAGQAEVESDTELSKTEEIRIMRALYRFATFYHLFGRNEGRRHGGFQQHEINDRFFGLFEPWEADAVGCIEIFIRSRYERIFEELEWDLEEDDDDYEDDDDDEKDPELAVALGDEELDGEFEHDRQEEYMVGTISRGLRVAHEILSAGSLKGQVARMKFWLVPDQYIDYSVEKCMQIIAHAERRRSMLWPVNSRDRAELRREPMTFAGDAAGPSAGPPLAWVLLWNKRYSNIYGGFVSRSLREMGYVMWDEARWVRMRLGGVVAREWWKYPDVSRHVEYIFSWVPIRVDPHSAPLNPLF